MSNNLSPEKHKKSLKTIDVAKVLQVKNDETHKKPTTQAKKNYLDFIATLKS